MAFKYNGVEPTAIKYKGVDVKVLKCSAKAANLKGQINRTVLSYSKASLDSYVGLTNDSWSQVEDADKLQTNEYYYIRVLVTDTNRYADFCVQFLSYNGKTIYTNNIGWGYEGETVGVVPFWGKHYKYSVTLDQNTLILYHITRVSSPNQHADTILLVPSTNPVIYQGDILRVYVRPKEHYKAVITINSYDTYVGEDSVELTEDITIGDGGASIVLSGRYVPYMHTLWTGSYSFQAKNQKVTVNWPVALPSGVTSVSINVNFSFRGKNVSGTYTVNNSGTNASAFIEYSGVSKTTMTISWKNNSQFYFESTGNSYYATATISSISCVY